MTDQAQLEALQKELLTVKEKWSSEIKLGKAKKGEPGFPFPVTVTRTIPQPPTAAHFDVYELKLKLTIEGANAGTLPVKAEVLQDLPEVVKQAVSKAVEYQWKAALAQNAGKSWLLEQILSWAEAKFADLLQLVPVCLDNYMGTDENGASMRRFSIIDPPPEPKSDESEDEEEEDDSDEEIDPALAEELERKARIKEAADREADRLWREQRKAEAEHEHKFVQLSKKDQQAMKEAKRGQGDRTAKTGPKARKAALSREAEAKEGKSK